MKSDKGKTPLIVLRCADNRQLFEGTGKGNGKAMKYAIYEGNIDRLEKKLKRISNKCKAYGCDFHYEQTGEEFRELKDEKGNKYTARFVLVEAEGTAIINDWEFIAELEHTENGNIITGVAGVEVPERYYTSKPMCEHCNSKRFRKNTYIVRNKQTGEFNGNTALPVGDYCWNQNGTGWRVAELGARWNSGLPAGAFYWYLYSASSDRYRDIGGRLVYRKKVAA